MGRLGIKMDVLTLNEVLNIKKAQAKSTKTVFVSGAFDLFHYGHYIALKKASKLGDLFIVQIDGDKLVKRRKGQDRPYFGQSLRAEIVASFDFVNCVFISNTPSEDVRKLKNLTPDVFVRAILNSETELQRQNRKGKLIASFPNMKIVWLEQTLTISSTKIIQSIKKPKKDQLLKRFLES